MKLFARFISLAIFLIASSFALAVSPAYFINDNAGVLTSDQKAELESLVRSHQAETGNEIGVLIVPELKNESVEELAVKTFEDWGIGKKGQDNGVLLLVAIKDRELRIEVGYGLEGSLTDLQSSKVIRDVITPEFKKGDYYSGIKSGLANIIGILKSEPELYTSSPKPGQARYKGTGYSTYYTS